jgi:hypothetical protein
LPYATMVVEDCSATLDACQQQMSNSTKYFEQDVVRPKGFWSTAR